MASTKIKGIQIEIGGNTDKLGKALENVEKSSKSLQSELRGVNSLLKLDPSNVDLLRQKQDLLTQSIDETSKKLDILKNAQSQVQKQFESGDITVEQYRDFQREIIATEQKLQKLSDEQKEFGGIVSQQLQNAGKKVEEFGGKIEKVGSKIEDMGTKFAPVSAGATAGLTVAITSASTLEEAINKYIAATGKSVNETEKYQNILQKIHDGGYGEDYADIADKMLRVSNIMGDLPDDQLENVVEKALMLEDGFGMDFQETLRGVNNLMYQYGLTADEAFDLFTKGAQEGLNFSDELGDNVSEYVGNFKQAGYSAQEYFQLLKNGSDNGAYNLDKVNDAINEIKNRLGDGTIKDNLKMFSSETQKTFKNWEKGKATMKDVIDSIVKDITNCKNEQEALTMAATAFGTMGEDSNLDFVKSLTSVGDTFKDVTNTAKNATDTMYGGTSSTLKSTIREIQSTMADLGNSLLPIINKALKSISNLVKGFNNLDDGTKDSIVSFGLLVAGISPLIILFGKLTTGVSQIVNGWGKMVEFGGRLVGKLTTMTAAQNANNAAVLANPYTLAAAAIAGLVAAIVIWSNTADEKTKKLEEENKKIKEQTEAVEQETQAYFDNVKAREEAVEQNMAEIDYYSQLYNELQGIVDQNGKIKEGYESRASFIVSTLADSLGIEINLVDGVIKNYKDLKGTIDNVVASKKAKIILDSQEEAYAEALKNKNEELKKAYAAQSEMTKLQTKLEKVQAEAREKTGLLDQRRLKKQQETLMDSIEKYKNQYNDHMNVYNSYTQTIGMYESNMQLYHDQKYNEMMATEDEYLVHQATNGTLSVEQIKKMITDTESNLNYLKELKKQNNTDIYDADILAQEQQLNSLKNSLQQQQTAVNIGNSNITNEWLTGIANQLTNITGKQYEFKKLGDGTVQMYIDGVKTKKPVAEKDMEKFANDMIAKVQKQKESKQAGENLAEGVKKGVNNRKGSVFDAIANFGKGLINKLKSTLHINSPSKDTIEMGSFLDEGIIVGIENKKREALRTATSFGKSILSSMSDSLKGNIDTPDINKQMMLEVGTNFTNSKYQQQQSNQISELISVLNLYMPEIIANMNYDVVLDDNTLVGKIAPKMDDRLGIISNKKRREF